MKTDYSAHEKIYERLCKDGSQGWGGDVHARRLAEWEKSLERLTSRPDFVKGPLLSLGCGNGSHMKGLALTGYEVTGVDISPSAIEWAQSEFKEQNLKGSFHCADLSAVWLFETDSFQVILDEACLHCIIGDDRRRFLTEAFRVLKKGGLFLISSMVGDPQKMLPEFGFDPYTRCQVKDGVAYRYMPKIETLIEEVRSAGFEIADQTIKENPWWNHAEITAKK